MVAPEIGDLHLDELGEPLWLGRDLDDEHLACPASDLEEVVLFVVDFEVAVPRLTPAIW